MESNLDKLLAHLREIGYKPRREGPKRSRLEDILKHTSPCPPEEAERFVQMIYEARRRDAEPAPK